MIKSNQFNFNSFYKHCYSYNLKKPNLDFLTWFIGFAEGDGSFLILGQNKTLGKHKLVFLIGQHSEDEQILQYIKHQFGK
jgi:hypothetical protein